MGNGDEQLFHQFGVSDTAIQEEFDEDPDDDDEEDTEWHEYWLVVGGVSKAAQEAIESVGGRVERLVSHPHVPGMPAFYAVCLLWAPDDDDQGYNFFKDAGKPARELFIASPGVDHTLYIHCQDGSIPEFTVDTPELRIVTQAEWFAMNDEPQE